MVGSALFGNKERELLQKKPASCAQILPVKIHKEGNFDAKNQNTFQTGYFGQKTTLFSLQGNVFYYSFYKVFLVLNTLDRTK